MKWPWVSRLIAEALERDLKQAKEAYNAASVAANMNRALESSNREAAARAIASAESLSRELEQAKAVVEAWKAHAERADARFDALWNKYLEATRPKEPKATVVGRYQTDEQVVRVVEDGFVEKLKAELVAKGTPDVLALAEARRIRKETSQYGVNQ